MQDASDPRAKNKYDLGDLALPTKQNRSLRYLAILGERIGLSYTNTRRGHQEALSQLPPSIERLDIYTYLLPPSIHIRLPKLTTLCLIGAGMRETQMSSFENCPALRSLVIHRAREATAVPHLLEKTGHKITYLQLSLDGVGEAFLSRVVANRLTKLEHLETFGRMPSINELALMPQSLTHLTIHDVKLNDVSADLVRELRDPSFLPGLEAFPDLFYVDSSEYEADVWLPYRGELDETTAALQSRGLYPQSTKRDRLYYLKSPKARRILPYTPRPPVE